MILLIILSVILYLGIVGEHVDRWNNQKAYLKRRYGKNWRKY